MDSLSFIDPRSGFLMLKIGEPGTSEYMEKEIDLYRVNNKIYDVHMKFPDRLTQSVDRLDAIADVIAAEGFPRSLISHGLAILISDGIGRKVLELEKKAEPAAATSESPDSAASTASTASDSPGPN